MYNSFKKKGLTPLGIFVNTLKDPKSAKWISKQIFLLNPACIINATSFSAKNNSGETPFSQSKAQVFQIALSTNDKSLWKKQERGMSPTDLAMHVALPEVDGSIFLGVASFKKKQKINKSLQFKQTKHQTFNYGISSITRKVCSWINLKTGGKEKLNPAFILSSYPGKKWQIAHAIGLDTISSLKGILEDNGFLKNNNNINLIQEIKNSKTLWSLKEYKESIKYIPHQLREKIYKKWGSPSTDHLVRGDFFSFNAFHLGRSLIAIQPERTNRYYSKKESYHDLSSVPCHSYIAFYLWMRHKINCSAIVHIGTHGTLEWLPGKSVALSENCWPEVLAGNIPVIYPFIINDPGEALQAKRRINAITIGHIPPKIVKVEKVKKLEFLETLLDEYSNADGLDPNRRERLKKDILDEAKNIGVDDTLDISNDTDKNEALEKIDRFVCDVKETQFGEGLHIFGREQKNNTLFNSKESASKEKDSLTRCLRGEKITPGPAGSPYRGKFDVLPSGRNIYANDHLSLPSRSAFKQGEKIAAEFLKDYLQENGDWPKNIIIDLWASATMRTNGESINHETPLSEVFEDQINCADLILLTKCDTISDSQISSAVNYVEKVKNNKIPVIKVTNGKVDTKAILSLQSETEKNIMHKHSHHEDHEDHDHEEFETFIYNLGVQKNKKNILDNIKALVENNEVLRIKGFIAIKNKPMRYLVQAVGRRIRGQFDTIWGEKENISSKIVIISQKNKINKKILDKYLNR